MKFNLKMLELIKNNSQPFEITRKQEGHLDDDGSWIDGLQITLICNLMITTARKEDESQLNIGNTVYQLIKIRQMKDDENLIQENDMFQFNGLNFKVLKQKLYMDHFSDFFTWFAVTEVDAK